MKPGKTGFVTRIHFRFTALSPGQKIYRLVASNYSPSFNFLIAGQSRGRLLELLFAFWKKEKQKKTRSEKMFFF